MRTVYIIVIVALTGIMLGGCEKYVDVKTQGDLVPGEYINYRYLLNYASTFEYAPFLGDYAADDVMLENPGQQQALSSSDYYAAYPNAYTWSPVIYSETSSYYYKDDNWNMLYNTIVNANIVIDEVPAVEDATEAEKDELIGEALVHRAFAYLCLVNTYAKPYDAATSDTDPGVPLVLEPTTVQELVRNPVSEVYAQVIADLNKALPALPQTQQYNTQPSKAAAYGVMARCYFYMNDYAHANAYADSALAIKSTLDDLGAITTLSSATYPLRISDPEILLSKIAIGGVSAYTPTAMQLSDTLLNVLDTTDQRYRLFTVPAATVSSSYATTGGRFFYKDRALGEGRNVGPNVPEMMLIKAEYYARNGDPANAMAWVNKLREKRFKPSEYEMTTATDATDALVKVLKERQREFFCRLLRWWDMRRLKSDARFQYTVTRTFNGETYTLEPSSNRYVFRISEYDRSLNPELEQNP